MAPKIVAVPSLNSAWTGKYDKNKSGAAHHNTIVLHNAQWPCQKCLGFSSFSFGTILSGAGLQTQTMAGVLIHVLAWRHRAPLCCCRVTQHTLSTRPAALRRHLHTVLYVTKTETLYWCYMLHLHWFSLFLFASCQFNFLR